MKTLTAARGARIAGSCIQRFLQNIEEFLRGWWSRADRVHTVLSSSRATGGPGIATLQMGMTAAEIDTLLRTLRNWVAATPEKLGSHQLDAHWSLAYVCGAAPEPWELYRVPALSLMPATRFFVEHKAEIEAALQTHATWDLLRDHAIEKIKLASELTPEECAIFGHPAHVQYYDFDAGRWASVPVPRIHWFDPREALRKRLESPVTADEFKARHRRQIETRLRSLGRGANTDYSGCMQFRQFVERSGGPAQMAEKRWAEINHHELRWDPVRRSLLQKLDVTCDFRKTLFGILRAAENHVRAAYGIAPVGEGWVSETELLFRIRKLFSDREVIHHGQPHWLGRQHLDIWLPQLSVAVEYQGAQHFKPIGRFGGDEAFRRLRERDARKRALCDRYGIRLVEIAYDEVVADDELLRRILGS